MSLSKNREKSFAVTPFVVQLVGKYFQQLYMHPIRTKSISSCVIASLGNLTSQWLYGSGQLDINSLRAFAMFGLIFGGTVPHTFYKFLETALPGEALSDSILRFLLERFMFTPMYQMVSLYTLSIFEGKNHEVACTFLKRAYLPVLKDNWRYLSIFQFINVAFVPPLLRVLFGNLIGFCWILYVSRKRRAIAAASSRGNRE